MQHEINIFLLLFGALQGWLLSLWFLKNHKRHLSNVYIATFLVVVSLQLTSKVIAKTWLMQNTLFFYNLSYYLPLLVGPLLFLYSRAVKTNQFNKRDLVHFAPFLAAALWMALAVFGGGAPFYLRAYALAFLSLSSLGIYSYYAYRNLSPAVRGILVPIVAIESVIIVTLAVMVMYYNRFPDVRLVFTGLTIVVYLMTYKLLSRSELFYWGENPVVPMNLQKGPKYAHSSLKPDEADRIEQLVRKVMVDEKLYMDPALTIDSLATKLAVSKHHISQILNERLNKTYSDFVNELRLEEAARRLSERSNYRFTIAAIALDSGFSSVSNFNEVFKKRFGVTPSKFRSEHMNRMSA